MYGRTMGMQGRSQVNLIDRRLFLARLAALGGASVATSGLDLLIAAEPPKNAGQVMGDVGSAAAQGKVLGPRRAAAR